MPDIFFLLIVGVPAFAIAVSILGVPFVAKRLPWTLPGKPRSGELGELLRLLAGYARGDARVDFRRVLGLTATECDLAKAEFAYRERLGLLHAEAPRAKEAVNALHRVVRDARVACVFRRS